MDDVMRQASDPGIEPAQLARLARDYPQARVLIAGNPAAYAGLLQWLGALGDPAVNQALSVRASWDPAYAATIGQGAPTPPPPTSTPAATQAPPYASTPTPAQAPDAVPQVYPGTVPVAPTAPSPAAPPTAAAHVGGGTYPSQGWQQEGAYAQPGAGVGHVPPAGVYGDGATGMVPTAPPPKRKRHLGLIITAAVIVVALAVAGVLFLPKLLGKGGSSGTYTMGDATVVSYPSKPTVAWTYAMDADAPEEWSGSTQSMHFYGLGEASGVVMVETRDIDNGFGWVRGLDAKTGDVKWVADLGSGKSVGTCGVSEAGGTVLCSTMEDGYNTTEMVILSASTGKETGSFSAAVPVTDIVSTGKDYVLLATGYDSEDYWAARYSGETKVWSTSGRPDTEDSTSSSNVGIDADYLYVNSVMDDTAWVLRLSDGKEVWSGSAEALATTSDGNLVIAAYGDDGEEVQTIDLGTGKTIRTIPFDGTITLVTDLFRAARLPGPVVVVEDNSDGMTVHAIEPETGKDTWTVTVDDYFDGALFLDSKRVILQFDEGTKAFDMADGTELWTSDMSLNSWVTPGNVNYDGTRILVPGPDGIVGLDVSTGEGTWTLRGSDETYPYQVGDRLMANDWADEEFLRLEP